MNPGADFDDHENELFEPPEEAATADDVARPNVQAAMTELALENIISGGRSPDSPGAPPGGYDSQPPTFARQVDRHSQSMTVSGDSPDDEKTKSVAGGHF